MTPNPDHLPGLDVDFAGIRLKNPVLAASGTFGYGSELSQEVDLNTLGGVITKGISLRPRSGNPPPDCRDAVGDIERDRSPERRPRSFLER